MDVTPRCSSRFLSKSIRRIININSLQGALKPSATFFLTLRIGIRHMNLSQSSVQFVAIKDCQQTNQIDLPSQMVGCICLTNMNNEAYPCDSRLMHVTSANIQKIFSDGNTTFNIPTEEKREMEINQRNHKHHYQEHLRFIKHSDSAYQYRLASFEGEPEAEVELEFNTKI